jgi:hypothetical protein
MVLQVLLAFLVATVVMGVLVVLVFLVATILMTGLSLWALLDSGA